MIDCSTCSVLGCQFNATNQKKSCEMYKPYMTPRNALHCMKFNCEMALCENCDIYGTVGTDHCFEDACREAIKALEKQIPKEPYRISSIDSNDNAMVDCPICKAGNETSIKTIKQIYCWKCGQAIKWE